MPVVEQSKESRGEAGRRQMSLRWKAFLVLLVVLALIHGGLGVRGYLDVMGTDERQLQQKFADYRRAMDTLLTQAVEISEREARELAASHHLETFRARDAARKYHFAEKFVDFDTVGYFDLEGTPLALWRFPGSAPAAPTEAEAQRRAVLDLARTQQPQSYVSCEIDCLLHVFVPVLQHGKQLAAYSAEPLHGTLAEFNRMTGADVGIVKLSSTSEPQALGDFWNVHVVALTNSELLRPLLTGLPLPSGNFNAGKPLSLKRGDRHLALSLQPLPLAVTGSIQMLLVAQRDVELALIADNLLNHLTLSLFGLILATAAIFIMLTPSLRRLTQITRALGLLGEQKFEEARAMIVRAQRPKGREDELDRLSRKALELSRRLQRLMGAEAASETKSQFLAAMSHEIRTPINGLLGLLELHEGSELNPAQRDSVRVMRDSALTLLTVIDDILDFSKLEAGQLSIDPVPTDLRDVVEGALEILSPSAVAGNLNLICYVQPGLPTVWVDGVRLRQVMLNLCSNAIKFTPRGSVYVEVTAATTSADTLLVRCKVFDTGIGIAPEAHARVFQRFSQAEASTARRFGGTGLGLSISKGLVEKHGGRIGFDSEPGRGSQFWFELDCVVAEQAPTRPPSPELKGAVIHVACSDGREREALRRYLEHAGARLSHSPDESHLVVRDGEGGVGILDTFAQGRVLSRPVGYRSLIREAARLISRQGMVEERSTAPAQPQRRRTRVLVAEDHPTNRLVIRQQLDRLGFEVDVMENGAQALQRIAEQPYALLLTDLNMPVMDGFALTREIRRRERTGARLPILALTADVMQATVERCVAAGMDDVLRKPVNLEQLARQLQRWLPDESSAPPPAPTPAAATPALPASGVIDRAELARIIGLNDPVVLQEVLQDFLAANRECVQQMAAAMAATDFEALRRLAHKLSGSARTIGASVLATSASQLEGAARDRQIEGLAELHSRTQAAFTAVAAEIEGARPA